MRILTLGCPLPDPQIDNHDWANAPSFFDYDVIVVDPAGAVSELVEGVLRQGASPLTYTDEPIEDGPTTETSVGLADLLRRRQEETERLLARGGLVVCFAQPDVPHPRVSGFPGCHRYYWLPAPPDLDYGPKRLRPAHGASVSVTNYEHPFADFLERGRHNVLYRALFAEGTEGFGQAATVIGRSAGGAAIAIELSIGSGRVVFLPALAPRLPSTERALMAHGLVTATRTALVLAAEGEPPEWISDYALPGIEEPQRQIEEAEARLELLESELNEARNQYRSVDRFRRILWQEGKYAFDLPVRDALIRLGFSTYSSPDEPASLAFGDETVLLETESSTDAVGMEPHYRLRQRLETQIAKEGKRARGLIVINGQRETAPAERPQQYEESLRVAAESMRYCVMEAATLFAAMRDHLEGRGDDAAFCRKLIETEGVLPAEQPAANEKTGRIRRGEASSAAAKE